MRVARAPGALAKVRFGDERSDAAFSAYVDLLTRWQRTHNLVSRSTIPEVWTRHIADSLQLLDHAKSFRMWIDLGSGAGFPGLICAIACREDAGKRFVLIESNHKKAAFLRAAIRATGAPAEVRAERIESAPKGFSGADVVSARALAPLPQLLGLARPYLAENGVMLLLKGQDFAREVSEASKSWDFDVIDSPSRTDPRGGRVLEIRGLTKKASPT